MSDIDQRILSLADRLRIDDATAITLGREKTDGLLSEASALLSEAQAQVGIGSDPARRKKIMKAADELEAIIAEMEAHVLSR